MVANHILTFAFLLYYQPIGLLTFFYLKISVFIATSFAGLISGGGQAEANRRRNH
ncbi:MAG: hypothetical protein J6U04_03100 [Salinivirgaceae bacterium]|nr:hypothetical protein [Salinivirgaceae bacterium]